MTLGTPYNEEYGQLAADMLAEVELSDLAARTDLELNTAMGRLVRYEQQPGVGLAVRKYVLQKRGVIASSAQRKPGSNITATAKAEVDYLLSRMARVDKRANLQPQSSAAG